MEFEELPIEIDILYKRKQRLELERLMLDFYARGGEVQQMTGMTYDEMKDRWQKVVSKTGEKKPPNKFWELKK